MTVEFRELQSFCDVARLRSMSKAAEHLGLTQPRVTTHIKRLEEELGVVLFDRIRRPIRITSAGGTLYRLAKPLVDGMEALVEEMTEVGEGGVMTVASTPVLSHPLLRVVSTFRAEHPQVQILVRSRTLSEVTDLVASGDADLGLVPGPERLPALQFDEVFVYDRVLLTPLEHPLLELAYISFADIAKWPLLLMGLSNRTRGLLEAEFQRRSLSYQVIAELDSMDTIKRHVALGAGISVGPRVAVDAGDEQQIGIVSLEHLFPQEHAGIVTLRGRYQPVRVQEFIGALRGRLRGMVTG